MAQESESEFDEDFGAFHSPADLERLLGHARANGDRDLRLLVRQHQTLRRVATDFLADMEARDAAVRAARPREGEPASYPAGLLYWLLRDEPRTPAGDAPAG